jgi:hypothetical protein
VATILGQITVDETLVIEVASDPSAAGGTIAPQGSLAIDQTGFLWTKWGATAVDWKKVVTESTSSPFITKSGFVASGTFAGSPKKATITFTTAFSSTAYSIVVTGIDARSWTIESQLAGSFVINANANQALTGNVFWQAQFNAEVG